MSIISCLKGRYFCDGGYKEFLKIALPLVLSLGIGAIELFTDRVFLSYYSQEAFAASTPAGGLAWAMVTFFMGSLSYVSVFVAQYYGKKEFRSIGPAIWQSLYLTIVAALILFCLSFLFKPFFMNIGHPKTIAIEEIKYAQTLIYCALVWIGSSVLSSFYSGIGKTMTVLVISVICALINCSLDYIFIFGKYGCKEMGIVGAAMASNISYFVASVIYIFLIISKKNNAIYNTRHFKLDFKFIKRLLHYGIPSGVELFFDGCGFSIFIIIVGSLGTESLAAGNIVASIYSVAYMPLLGAGTATSVMVGKYLGANKISLANLSLKSALHISYVYIILLIIIINVFSTLFLAPFALGAQASIAETVQPIAKSLLLILSMFFVFDTGSVMFASVLKGAGDTAYVMKIFIYCSLFLEVIPAYLNVVVFKNSITTAWVCFIIYIAALCFAFLHRYNTRKWEKMRVIEF